MLAVGAIARLPFRIGHDMANDAAFARIALSEFAADRAGLQFQLLACRISPSERFDLDLERIAGVARDDVKMYVEDGLAGDLTVRQKQIRSFTAQARCGHRVSDSRSDGHHVATVLRVETIEPGGVVVRNHQGVAFDYGTNVHEGGDLLVAVDDAGVCGPLDDLTENTIGISWHGF